MAENLWPEDIIGLVVRTPISVLKEQAANLGLATQQLVKAVVETGTASGTFYHHFYIQAPAINYRYMLLGVQHEVTLYPCYLSWDGDTYEITNEDGLLERLKIIFSDEKTRKIVGALLSQAQS